MSGFLQFISLWNFDPSVVLGCAALTGVYFVMTHRYVDRRHFWIFNSGTLIMFLALVSPLDLLSDTYLFSAHMFQHLVLLLVAPLLWVRGMPPEMEIQIISKPALRKMEGLLRRPLVAWLIGVATIWIWHIPSLYNLTLQSDTLHIFEHLCFLVSGVIFWWPILAPLPESRMPALMVVPYLFASAAASILLGILETFSGPGIYPAYISPEDIYHLLPLLRGRLGLNPVIDHQLGGLMMWVLGGLVYLVVLLGKLGNWLGHEEEQEQVENVHKGKQWHE